MGGGEGGETHWQYNKESMIERAILAIQFSHNLLNQDCRVNMKVNTEKGNINFLRFTKFYHQLTNHIS